MNRIISNKEYRMMKWVKLVLGVLIGVMISGCFEKSPESQAVVVEQGDGLWKTDFSAAQKQAAAENKHILLSFSGSDWCPPCMALDREVFSAPEFVAYAKTNLILVQADFPRNTPLSAEQGAANQTLAERFGVETFPSVFILTPQGRPVARTGYRPGGSDAYIEKIKGAITE